MERVTKHLEEKLADLELTITTREQGIDARKAYGIRIGKEIQEVKQQIKTMACGGITSDCNQMLISYLEEMEEQGLGGIGKDFENDLKRLLPKPMSTKYLDATRKQLVESFNQNTGIVKHLKQDLSMLRHDAYCTKKAIDALNK
jgi:hypothetical protein